MKWRSLMLLPALILAAHASPGEAHGRHGHHGGHASHHHGHYRPPPRYRGHHHRPEYAVRINAWPHHGYRGHGAAHYYSPACGHYPHHYGVGFGIAVDGFSFSYRHGH